MEQSKTCYTNYKFIIKFFILENFVNNFNHKNNYTGKYAKEKIINGLDLEFLLIEDVRSFLHSDFYKTIKTRYRIPLDIYGIVIYYRKNKDELENIYRELYAMDNLMELEIVDNEIIYHQTTQEFLPYKDQVLHDSYNISKI